MEKKGNLTPVEGVPASNAKPASGGMPAASPNPDQPGQTGSGQQRTRRTDARRGVSEKITVCALADGSAGAVLTTGWALNMSRSGVRAILEERVLAGVDYEITIGEVGTSQLTRRARVVWVQEEHDGVVVGLEFLVATSSTAPPTGIGAGPLADLTSTLPPDTHPDSDPITHPDGDDTGRITDPDPTSRSGKDSA